MRPFKLLALIISCTLQYSEASSFKFAPSGFVNPSTSVMTKKIAAKVSRKNTRELGATITGMLFEKAKAYLTAVQERRRCVPFRRYNSGLGRTKQAKEWGATQGRWPVKSCEVVKGMLKEAQEAAEKKGLDTSRMKVVNVQVLEAPTVKSGMFRAFGKIVPYNTDHCHIVLVIQETERIPMKRKRARPTPVFHSAPPVDGDGAEDPNLGDPDVPIFKGAKHPLHKVHVQGRQTQRPYPILKGKARIPARYVDHSPAAGGGLDWPGDRMDHPEGKGPDYPGRLFAQLPGGNNNEHFILGLFASSLLVAALMGLKKLRSLGKGARREPTSLMST